MARDDEDRSELGRTRGGHASHPPPQAHAPTGEDDPVLVQSFMRALELHERGKTPAATARVEAPVKRISEWLPSAVQVAIPSARTPVAAMRWTSKLLEGFLDVSLQVTPAGAIAPGQATLGPIQGLTWALFAFSDNITAGPSPSGAVLSDNEAAQQSAPLALAQSPLQNSALPVPWTSSGLDNAGGSSVALAARVFVPEHKTMCAVFYADPTLLQPVQLWGWLDGYCWTAGSLTKDQILRLVSAGPDRSF